MNSAAIHTDSLFLVNAMTKWIFNWLKTGWCTLDGSEVINKSDFRNLLRASEGFNIQWVSLLKKKMWFTNATRLFLLLQVHVRGHSKVDGNLEAHKLAQIGARIY